MLTADALPSLRVVPRTPEHPDDGRLPLGLALPAVLGVSAGLWVLIYQGIRALVG